MAIELPILSETAYREAKALIEARPAERSSFDMLSLLTVGVDAAVADHRIASVRGYLEKLSEAVDYYEDLKAGKFEAKRYPGPEMLVAARISQNITQKELAEKSGLLEQQVQRYERERYRNIKSSTWLLIARSLNVEFRARIKKRYINEGEKKISYQHSSVIAEFLENEDERFLNRVKSLGKQKAVEEYVARVERETGSQTLYRRSLRLRHGGNDPRAKIWAYRLRQKAVHQQQVLSVKYDPLSRLPSSRLAQLTASDDPVWEAVKFLRENGILVLYVPHVRGSSIDGGAIVVNGTPVIGVTARLDRRDNFWFTLFHELAHVELHLSAGIDDDFVDGLDLGDSKNAELEEIEKQADDYAFGMVQPADDWRRSLARKANRDGAKIVVGQAKRLGVDPAIIFGRIRHERKDYSIFTAHLGANMVRSRLIELRTEGEV